MAICISRRISDIESVTRLPRKLVLAGLLIAALLIPGSAFARQAQSASAKRTKAHARASRNARAQRIVLGSNVVRNGVKIGGRKVVWVLRHTRSKPARVVFRIDGAKRWTDRHPPYRFRGDKGYLDTTKLTNGSHTLVATAIHSTSATTSRIKVTVVNRRPWGGSTPPTTTTPTTTTPTTTTPTTTTPTTTTPTTTTPTTTTPTTTTPTTTTPTTTSLQAKEVDSGHIQLTWSAVAGASAYRVYRGSTLLTTTSATSVTDAMLWPETGYTYRVDAVSASATVLGSMSSSATTSALPSSGFARPFSSTSVWNTPIGGVRLVSNNDQLIANFESNALYPNMALNKWAVSIAEAQSSDPLFNVFCAVYNPCTLTSFGSIPIPSTAAADPSSDGHMAVYDPANGRTWGMWKASKSGSTWTAAAGEAVSTQGDGIVPSGTVASNAANFPLLAGVVRPEEILQGHIDHALVFTLPEISSAGHVCPATHDDGSSSNPSALMEGMRLQLDPSLDVDSLSIPAWQKTIAKALQKYGMYLRDGSGSLAIIAENPVSRGYDAWAKVGLSGNSVSLAGIPWDRFRVVSAPC
jgi:cell division septation protein DedD